MRTRASNSLPSEVVTFSVFAPLLQRREVEALLARQPERLGRLAVRELERQDAHADQVRAVDPLVRLGQHEAHAEQARPLAAQSRDEPEPYSLPAITHSGVPSSWYSSAAS